MSIYSQEALAPAPPILLVAWFFFFFFITSCSVFVHTAVNREKRKTPQENLITTVLFDLSVSSPCIHPASFFLLTAVLVGHPLQKHISNKYFKAPPDVPSGFKM
jgi:hypothetical protein